MSYNFFENKDCEYYPCHKMDEVNCLFCFCPLYSTDCGGNYKMIKNSRGEDIKDCSDCQLPHSKEGYEYILSKLDKKDE